MSPKWMITSKTASWINMRRYMGVKVQGAIVDINRVNADVFRAEHMVIVDVSDITKQFVDGQFNEYYRIHRTNRLAPPVPGSATMGQIDTVYLVGFAEALYGRLPEGSLSPFRFLPYYNGNPNNLGGSVGSWSGNMRVFQKPYEWLDGENAIMYGGEVDPTTGNQLDRIMVAGLLQYSNSIIPVDASAMIPKMNMIVHLGGKCVSFITKAKSADSMPSRAHHI